MNTHMNTRMNPTLTRLGALSIALIAAALALTGCAAAAGGSSDDSTMAQRVTSSDLWVKEPTSDMTGMFGMLENTGTSEVVLVGGESDIASMVEVHEVVDGQMQKRAGGLSIPPGEIVMLEPGGNHLMMMGLTSPLLVGEQVSLTLTFSDGSSTVVTGVVKTAAGGEESYSEEPAEDLGM